MFHFVNKAYKNCLNSPFIINSYFQNVKTKKIHTSSIYYTFWEREKKSGYGKKIKLPSKKQLIIDGLKELKHEINLWTQEVKEKLEMDPILVYRPGRLVF